MTESTTGTNRLAHTSLVSELATVLNRHSRENISNTPDFILADFLMASLTALEQAITARVEWHGRAMFPSMTDNDVLAKTAAEHLSTRASLQDKLAKYEALTARAARCRSVRPSYDSDEMQRIVDALAEI